MIERNTKDVEHSTRLSRKGTPVRSEVTCNSAHLWLDRWTADKERQKSSGAFHMHSVVKLDLASPRLSVGVPKPTFIRGKEA